MNIENINYLRKKYSELPDYKEETIKVRIVKPFLEMLGFIEDWHRYEHPVIKNKSITDITILKDNKIILIVEIKKGGDYLLRKGDTQQLLTYLITKNVEWGIVTNGYEFILVNRKINGELADQEIMKFNLLDDTEDNMKLLKYFLYKSIFSSQITNYKKHLAQFNYYRRKESNNLHSLFIYNSTISRYFDFLIDKFRNYRALGYLSKEDFKEFIIHDINESKNRVRNINSKITIFNKYRHITKLYELFVKHEHLTHNPFRFITEEEMIEDIKGISLESEDFLEHTSIETLKELINLYNNSRDSERNKLIFSLCLYAGLGRDEIRNLKLKDVDLDNMTLNVNNVIIPIPSTFAFKLKNYIENVRNKNTKVEYLFDSNYGNYAGGPVSQSTINSVINRNTRIINNKFSQNKRIKVNPENLRKLLVRKFFETGFSIEEIVTITGMELNRIVEHISTDEIKERTLIKSLPHKHPYFELFAE
ncbi:tyrosine-type recombinase/integrase [Priestia megaterium]|uniref:tyrosine-type recombinase/integrase n=1 Tax=Priestia megaterium TaxID=1404 RepID=UPI001786C821|nr:tyrosine-type recombinase/integrase [Priestia megaterium]